MTTSTAARTDVGRYPLTLIGVVLLIALLIVAAILLNTGEQGQRFTIVVGVIATTITALLALLRTELTAKDAEIVRDAVATESGAVTTALDQIKNDIAENTEISKQAFVEANNFTERLIEQGRQFDALLGAAVGRQRPADATDLAVDTNEKVSEVHETVVGADDD